jgi:hypothetical protein
MRRRFAAPALGISLLLGAGPGAAAVVVSDPVQHDQVAIVGHVGGSAWDVAIQGGHLYTAGSVGLQVFDLAVPSAPQAVGTFVAPGGLDGRVEVIADRAYLASGALRVFDVATPSAPLQLAALDLGPAANAQDVAVADGFAYVATVDDVRVVDVRDAGALHVLGAIEGNGRRVVAADGFLYVAGAPLRIYDLADPGAPVAVVSPLAAQAVAVDGARA